MFYIPSKSKNNLCNQIIDDYTAMPYNQNMEFIEATAFTRHVYEYLTDEEYIGLQNLLAANPEMGRLVPGTGGVRKIRWAIAGRGKSGGIRVIYYFKRRDDEIWMLTIYQKNEIENIPAHILKQITREIEND